MATVTNYKGSFITGWNQREIHADMKVDAVAKVGTLCIIKSGTTDTLQPITSAPTAGTKYYMIAQSDDTLGDGHIPVEYRDWLYSDAVAASAAKKHVAYYIVDTNDITATAYSYTTA